MSEMLALEFMRNALIGAVLVGFAAPLVGIFLVQRRMSLVGDGMGHVALAGVAIGVLTGTQPVYTALIAAVLAAVAIELLRERGSTSGDVALALMFYGGIAAGVVLMSQSTSTSAANLTGFLFGAILTTTQGDLIAFAVLAAIVVATVTVLRQRLFAVANDEVYARATGMRVTTLNLTLAVLTATTVVISMRIVGLLLISALMILPNAIAQRISSSFAATARWGAVIGIVTAVAGVVTSYYAQTPSGGTIVLILIAVFIVVAVASGAYHRFQARTYPRVERHDHEHGPDCGHEAIPHGDHVDYLHDGHRHAAHQGHYDEHHPDAHEHQADHVSAKGPR
ncbi:MAG TPA: metal ABC transporter permease [Intrasporangiaceae bacterium]|nr:metal ABC transporter permease [Intrasporangiaceae bacterium]